jgi:acyl dehydratase/NAD(P)-dependent dehydrogenase (short-subunit alcohol dehydrogenase family)
MTQQTRLARRTFTDADQSSFAAVSGDRNPMHFDAVLARRTQAGARVVHGMHLLLWALDALAGAVSDRPPMRRLVVRFGKFVYVGDEVEVVLAQRSAAVARLTLVAAGLTVAQIAVDFGTPPLVASGASALDLASDPVAVPTIARDLAFEQMAGLSGKLAFATAPDMVEAMFPAAADWLGPRRVAALAASTLLVGMVCPGLHSIYGSLTLDACDEPDPQDRLGFRVIETDARFRLVRQAIVGGGVIGMVDSFVRIPPTQQVSMQSLAGVVSPTEFAGSFALVVGGSRGLGEVAAKLLASGGAWVVLTYRAGRADAEMVAGEIRAAGGACDALAYDVGQAAEPQLARLANAPTHAYYFATPPIFRAQAALFERTRMDTFLDAYVSGFWNLAQALRTRRPDVSLFYPSSIALEQRPRGMAEYSMAKAAGETLCTELNLAWAPLHVTMLRLPRLATDQTASIIETEMDSAVDCLLPAVREVQSWPRPAAQIAPALRMELKA